MPKRFNPDTPTRLIWTRQDMASVQNLAQKIARHAARALQLSGEAADEQAQGLVDTFDELEYALTRTIDCERAKLTW
jgi:hypothetical protein